MPIKLMREVLQESRYILIFAISKQSFKEEERGESVKGSVEGRGER